MKNILAIIGSPRKLGNSEIMAKEISRNIREPHELSLIRLPDFNILPCKGCYTCLFKEACPLDDDFALAARAVLNADALIVVAPAYFLGPNACLKRFTDRGLSLYRHTDVLMGKPAVGIGIAGIHGREGYTLLGIESFLKLLLADIKQKAIVYGALPGEVFMNEANRTLAVSMATALFGDTHPAEQPCCPLCGGQTFRFLGGHHVRCMLCSNTGSITMEGGQPSLAMEKGAHEMFLTRQDALDHAQWLRGMKNRFKENKKRLKGITLDYRQEGCWINPDKN